MNGRPLRVGRRVAVRWRGWRALCAAGIWLTSAGGWSPRAGAQTIQPFEESTPTPTPARAPVRRAQPVTPTDPPVARAIPVDPRGTVAPSANNRAAETPSPTPRRRAARPTATPTATATPTRRNDPAPGNNGPDEPVDPTPTPDTPASATRDPEAAGRPRAGGTATAATALDETAPPRAPATASGTGKADATPSSEDGGDEIRIAPQTGHPVVSPEETQFNLANRFYVAKDYTQAAAEYERYLGKYPDGSQREAAMWWLGESYRFLKRTPAARSSYQMLTIAFPDGKFTAPANFRMAIIDYEARDYQTALGLFRKAAGGSKAQDVILYSRYCEALCLEQLGRKDETREVYENVLSFTQDNPYRDDAHLKLAELAMNQRRPNDAFKQYEALSREASKPVVQADSSLRAGILAHELGQDDAAMTLLSHAASLPGGSAQLRADAMIAQLHLLYDTNKYKELLAAYPGMKYALTATLQPEAMLMAANAQRQLGRHQEARTIYDELITQYPNTPQAPEARYQRIISLYATDDPNFVREADDFLFANADPAKTDQVRLMKADTLFKRHDYQGAAPAYAALDGAVGLPPKYKAEAAYRLGYCYAQSRQPERTVAAFSKFLRAHPEHPLAAKALIQRGMAYQQLKNYGSALQDFTEVMNDHKDAKEREAAMAQRAVILGAQNETRGMIEAFRSLLKEYPGTEMAGLAHYSIATTAFSDLKDYATALSEFDAARKAAPKDYGPKASLMMILCEYQLKDKAKLAVDVEAYQKAKPVTAVPPTILGWLGQQEFEDKNYAAAEEHLSAIIGSPGIAPEEFLSLAQARLNLQKWDGALEAAGKYLSAIASEPDARALGLLVQGEAQLGLQQYAEAAKSVEETVYIQPEGKLNARALLLRGKIEAAQGKYADAAKSFMSVSVLYDDNEITPEALRQAAAAFTKAGQPSEAAKANDELKARFPGFTAAKML